MKWALILVWAGGQWDTGLTYPSFDACFEASQKIWTMEVKTYGEESEIYADYFGGRHKFVCVPTK